MPVEYYIHTANKLSATPLSKALCWSGWVLWSLLIVATAGCGGCDSDPNAQQKTEQEKAAEEEKKDQKADKKKIPVWEVSPPRALIGPQPKEIVDPETKKKTFLNTPLVLKPGHWTATVQDMKANYEDFVGQISTALLDKNARPVRLLPTQFTFQSTRPVVLAKGRPKRILDEIFIPEQTAGVGLQSKLLSRNSGANITPRAPLSLKKMPSYQYHLVVLAKEPSRYGFLKVADAVLAPWEGEFEGTIDPHYRVLLADASKALPLTDNMLTWTSVAYLVWDEVDPTRIAAEQQQALVDWLHWGGRLIINGPDSLDTLRGSFLDPYLPVDKIETKKFTASQIDSWSTFWSQRPQGVALPALEPIQPWSGIQLKPRPHARELAGGDGLFYAGNVGRGVVVVSAIQLTERDLTTWPGYDGFLNAALLGRPARKFSPGAYGKLSTTWAEYDSMRLDAHFTTGLRLFARDTATPANITQDAPVPTNPAASWFPDNTITTNVDRPGGIGSWNAFGPGATVARESLTAAAAVLIPGPGFVIMCLAVYLAVLVPLNWMVFKSLGRVEWAWIAAPVIALAGTWAVVRLAQLDIGFVRSQTEIALLELQGAHPRGLLSRYTALYSSLATTYDINYENPTALATPFPAGADDKFRPGDSTWDVVLDKQRKTTLSGITISSASTRMVQSEEVFACEGPLRLGQSSRGHKQIENKTQFNFHDVIVVHRTFTRDGSPRFEGSWIGDLRAGRSAVLGLTPLTISQDQLPYAEERSQAAQTGYQEQLDTDALLRLAFQFPSKEDPLNARREEYRAVGIIDEVLPGTAVLPKSSQIQGTTVVLAHLQYGPPRAAQPDINSRADIKPKEESDFDFDYSNP